MSHSKRVSNDVTIDADYDPCSEHLYEDSNSARDFRHRQGRNIEEKDRQHDNADVLDNSHIPDSTQEPSLDILTSACNAYQSLRRNINVVGGALCLPVSASMIDSSDLSEDDTLFSQKHPVSLSESQTETLSSNPSDSSSLAVSDSELASLHRSRYRTTNTNRMDSAVSVIEDIWSGLFTDARDEIFDEDPDKESIFAEGAPADSEQNNSTLASERARSQRNGGLSGWDYASPFKAHSISVDDANRELAFKFLLDANVMLRNVVDEVNCRRRSKTNSDDLDENCITMMETFETFLPESVLEKIRANVNRVLAARQKECVSIKELRGVIVLHVLAVSYSSSVSTITSRENAEFFYQLGIPCDRYTEIWKAFSCTKDRRQNVERSDTGWPNRPTRGNSLITELEQELAAVNRTFLYVPGATISSLDDDHQRLSSRAVTELTNLSHINNPAKALGPVNNALCSALNPVFIASHYSRPREKQIYVWERLVQLVQGVSTSGATSPMTDAIFAADRGYNSKETISFLNDRLCAIGLGTHKRSLDYPFLFGDGPLSKRHKGMTVSEKGCRAIYSAKSKPSSKSGRVVEAAVYRESFSGRIASVYHNNEQQFSAHKFTLIPKDAFRTGFDASKLEEVQVEFDRDQRGPRMISPGIHSFRSGRHSVARMKFEMILRNVEQLTVLQSEDPGWFLARAFMFTSRTSHTFIRAMAAHFDSNLSGLSHLLRNQIISLHTDPLPNDLIEGESVLRVRWEPLLELLNMRRGAGEDRAVTADAVSTILSMSESSLGAMRKDDINGLLSAVGKRQPASMRKQQLIEKIMQLQVNVRNGTDVLESTSPPQLSVEDQANANAKALVQNMYKASLDSWVMKPLVATAGMKEGCKNEIEVLKAIPDFFDRHEMVDTERFVTRSDLCRG